MNRRAFILWCAVVTALLTLAFVKTAEWTFAPASGIGLHTNAATGVITISNHFSQITGSATLNFGSNFVALTVEDLPIAVTGAATGDPVFLGIPSGAPPQAGGTFFAFASNDVVYVRWAPVNGSQDPQSGTFKVTVIKQ